jgi:outer membrane protein OmpA-like peptidoglycan-associated protein
METPADKKLVFAPTATTPEPEVEKKKEKKKIISGGFIASEFLKPVYFDVSKSQLSADAQTIVQENVVWLKTQPPYLIEIVGIADQRGGLTRNRTLAERRAMNLKNAYVALGIAPERIQIVGLGEGMDSCPTMEEECLKMTRRADTRVEKRAFLVQK